METSELIEKSRELNAEILNKCRSADRRIMDITSFYNKRVSGDCPFVVSFVGRFKTGKSSLINALIGADILPTKATTATSVVTRIFYGDTPKCRRRDQNGDKEISIDEGREIILGYQVKDTEHPVEIIFELPVLWIKSNIEIRDTPGMDDSSQDGRLETIALNALRDTDMCVCVYDASTMISQKERERTQKIHKMMSGNVVYAVNCTNRLNSLENVRQVEALSENFFGSMSYDIPDMGKFYMMCSAPGMLALDGFDKWLGDFLCPQNADLLNRMRSNAGKGQTSVCKTDFAETAGEYYEQLREQLDMLNKAESEILEANRANMKIKAENRAVGFKNAVSSFANDFVIIADELKDKIRECKDKETDYEANTKNETMEYFVRRYKELAAQGGCYFDVNDVRFIRQAFQSISFPGKHTIKVKATSEEKNGWTAAGAIIGTFFGLGIGSAIGAAIGRSIGAADTTADNSVDNTMSYIESSVVPLMKKAINGKIENIAKAIKNDANDSGESGMETIIKDTKAAMRIVYTYIAK